MELRLKQLRTDRGLSQEELAQSLGIKKSRYGTWERGERMISLEQAYDCAVALGCTLNDLVGMKSERVFADSGQQQINDQYEEMNEVGKGKAVGSVDDIHANPANLKSTQGMAPRGATGRQETVA